MTLETIYKLAEIIATTDIPLHDIEVTIAVESNELEAFDRELYALTKPNTPFKHTKDVNIAIGGLNIRLTEKT